MCLNVFFFYNTSKIKDTIFSPTNRNYMNQSTWFFNKRGKKTALFLLVESLVKKGSF